MPGRKRGRGHREQHAVGVDQADLPADPDESDRDTLLNGDA